MAEANEKTKVILYWLNKSRSQRILWLLEELKIDYELKTYNRGKDMLAPPELKEVHPLGKSPVIGVQPPGAPKPVIIAESGLIVEYLTEYFGKQLIPRRYPEGKDGQIGTETEEWLRYRFFMHYAEGSLMTLMVITLFINQIRNAQVPFFIKPVTKGIAGRVDNLFLTKNYATHFGFLEHQLATAPGDGPFMCGSELTGADIMMVFPLEGAAAGGLIKAEDYPKLSAWLRRMHERDAYKNATKVVEEKTGEPYDAKF